MRGPNRQGERCLCGLCCCQCADVAKGLGMPVLHANADDPEAVVRACRIAAEWRAEFGRDVIVDVCGYRRCAPPPPPHPPHLPGLPSII